MLSQLLQAGRGSSPLQAGPLVTSSAAMPCTGAMVSFRLVPKHGLVVVIGGMTTMVGPLPFAAQPPAPKADAAAGGTLVPSSLTGTGNGTVPPRPTGASLVTPGPQQTGADAGVLDTAPCSGSRAGIPAAGSTPQRRVGRLPVRHQPHRRRHRTGGHPGALAHHLSKPDLKSTGSSRPR
ncbi:hypothetical protein [Streptomyces rubradiris]|uniref:hypothetical protein n=1 Tax=Streptomyces rubradiris TaxID=285531 RepID=UPI001679F849|nr:hypothetical protein [Streptomyces rubradiris]